MSRLSRGKVPQQQQATSATSVVAGCSKKLRSELRRVMSDRVLKITRCSQQQTVEKIKQRQNPENASLLSSQKPSQSQTEPRVAEAPSSTINAPLSANDLSPKFLAKISFANKISPKNSKLPANKISLQPIKTFDLKDKESLIKHVKTMYNEAVSSNASIVLAVQSILNSIVHYIQANHLDLKNTVHEILKEHLFQTNIQLKQKYKAEEQSEKLKIEGEAQVLLQIEYYIIANSSGNKVRVDDDWVWEIANLIRWLKQTFKDFKIERFLFGEVYSNYFMNASEFILSLMEELGYDKEDNDNPSSASPKTSPSSTPSKQTSLYFSSQQLNESGNETQPAPHPTNSLQMQREDSNSSYTFAGGVNSLFEEECGDEADTKDPDEPSQNASREDSKDALLDEFEKKKTVSRFSDFSMSSARSIVVQRKRMRLKIRSPYKSPSKARRMMTLPQHDILRKSPRIKEKPTHDFETSQSQKRPRTYLITDTPDHKQNATIITTRQEKLRKRFSFQQFNQAPPVVPDTPVKGEGRAANNEPAPNTASSIIARKLYASPRKSVIF